MLKNGNNTYKITVRNPKTVGRRKQRWKYKTDENLNLWNDNMDWMQTAPNIVYCKAPVNCIINLCVL
jgi:hypothetical protein